MKISPNPLYARVGRDVPIAPPNFAQRKSEDGAMGTSRPTFRAPKTINETKPMFLSGVTDEAGSNIDNQIKATKELGWKNMEVRGVEVSGYPKGNIHDIPDRAFDILCDKVAASGLKIHCFGSTIANWGKKID